MTLPYPLDDSDTFLLARPSASLFSDEMEGPSLVGMGVFDVAVLWWLN